MPGSKPKGSCHVYKEYVDASHPDQSRLFKIHDLEIKFVAVA